MGRVRHVFFDLDDTLIMDHGSAAAAFAAACSLAAREKGVDAEALERVTRETARARWFALKEELPELQQVAVSSWEALWIPVPREGELWRHVGPKLDALRLGAWSDGLESFGVEDLDLARRVARTYAQARSEQQLVFPEAPAVLADVEAVFPVGLITNGLPNVQAHKLKRAGLSTRFEPIVASGGVGVAKPDPGIFRYALNYARVAPKDAVMIGNSYDNDVIGANAAGIRAVWVNREGQAKGEAPAPDAEIADLRELPPILRTWNG